MKNQIFKTLVLIGIIFISSCASRYRPINPVSIIYSAHDMQEGISLSYKYDVLREKGNKKFAKKEARKNISLIAVKITNNTDTSITIGKDVAFFSGQNQLLLMDPMVIRNSIKQTAPAYLPFLLLTFLQFNVITPTSTKSYPIGLLLGPGLTIGNMGVAASANSNLLMELKKYSMLNYEIKKGETAYGIIGLNSHDFRPIYLSHLYNN